MSAYRPEFEAALRILAQVSEAVKAQGYLPPVLVGGAAVELYTLSTVATGDFDVVTPRQDVLEQAMQSHGFVKPHGGPSMRGWVHPEHKLGFEVVGSTLLDGNADRDRILLVSLGSDGEIAVIGIEDMIADRMGQYASGTANEMREQARRLYALHKDVDLDYLERRIREETGNEYGAQDLEDQT